MNSVPPDWIYLVDKLVSKFVGLCFVLFCFFFSEGGWNTPSIPWFNRMKSYSREPFLHDKNYQVVFKKLWSSGALFNGLAASYMYL